MWSNDISSVASLFVGDGRIASRTFSPTWESGYRGQLQLNASITTAIMSPEIASGQLIRNRQITELRDALKTRSRLRCDLPSCLAASNPRRHRHLLRLPRRWD